MKPSQIRSLKDPTLRPNPYLTRPQDVFGYQSKMVLMMLAVPRLIDGDDVGIGKTLEMIVAYTYMKMMNPDTKLLVITEANAYMQWVEEFAKWTTGLKVRMITTETHPDPGQRIQIFRKHTNDVIITGYGQLYKYWEHMREGMLPRWVFCGDEPNYFKNIHTEVHDCAFQMVNDPVKGASRAYGLTATVIENGLYEAYGISRVICPGVFPSEKEFEDKYCNIDRRGKGKKRIKGYKNLDGFRRQLGDGFYGRLQDDPEVKQALPEVFPKDIPIMMSREQSEKVQEAVDTIITLPDGTTKQVDLMPSMILAQQLCNHPAQKGYDLPSAKMKAAKEMMTNSLSNEKVVIYSKFRSMIDILEEELENLKIDTVRITGAETIDDRALARKRFNEVPGNRPAQVCLINKAGSKAVNLQAGGHLIYYDLPWSYGIYRQVTGRVKRTGSRHAKVGVYRLLARLHPDIAGFMGSDLTIDDYTLKVVLKKFGIWKAVTGDTKEIESGENDLVDIFNQIKASRRKVT